MMMDKSVNISMLVKVWSCRSHCNKNRMRRKKNYEGLQVQEIQNMSELSSQCSGERTSSRSPIVVTRYSTTPLRQYRWLLDMLMIVVVVMLLVTPCSSLEARCPLSDDSDTYCECNITKIRSGMQINIRCDFQMKEDVLLTEKLFPFRESKALRASVLLANATSVMVTQAFLGEWLHVLSVGLDLWNCGTVRLTSAPFTNLHFPHSFSTFIGMGIVGCEVPEIPSNLLRDRNTASLRIKQSVVGTVRQGVISAVRKVGYIVLEDTLVEKVEGTLAMNGYLDLTSLNEANWNGLILRNVTVGSLAPGSFNVIHKAKIGDSTHKVEVKGCRVDKMGQGGITAQGDVAVTIIDNSFGYLADEAFKISVSRDFKFEGNIMESAGKKALMSLQCQNLTMLDMNMIFIKSERNITDLLHHSFNPFHVSCSQSQEVFRVINMETAVTYTVLSTSTWVLLVLHLLLVVAAGYFLYQWRESNKLVNMNQDTFNSYNGVSSSARYQTNQQEVDVMQGGVSDPLYDRTQL